MKISEILCQTVDTCHDNGCRIYVDIMTGGKFSLTWVSPIGQFFHPEVRERIW